jgi:hypothetical protein
LLLVIFLSCLTGSALIYSGRGIPSSNLLSVRYFSQETSYYCGPASIQMVFSYLQDDVPSQDQIAVEVNCYEGRTRDRAGTFSYDVRKPFDDRGYGNVYEQTLNIETLKSLSSSGKLVIIEIFFDVTHQGQHYVVVVGYDGDRICIDDPWDASMDPQPTGRACGSEAYLSAGVLNDLWNCNPSYWGLVIPYPAKSGGGGFDPLPAVVITLLIVASFLIALVIILRIRERAPLPPPPPPPPP